MKLTKQAIEKYEKAGFSTIVSLNRGMITSYSTDHVYNGSRCDIITPEGNMVENILISIEPYYTKNKEVDISFDQELEYEICGYLYQAVDDSIHPHQRYDLDRHFLIRENEIETLYHELMTKLRQSEAELQEIEKYLSVYKRRKMNAEYAIEELQNKLNDLDDKRKDGIK